MAVLHHETDFEKLVRSKDFAEFTQLLIKLTGLAMALNSPEGTSCNNLLGGNKNNKVCHLIRNSEKGSPKCMECDRRHYKMAANSGTPLIYTCHAGFWDMAVPVLVQGHHIATLSGGQVLPAPVSEEGFQALRQRLAWLNISDRTLRKAYESAPYLPKAKLRHVMSLLQMFARQLCDSLRQIRELEGKLEKEEIRKAKEYIHEKFSDPLLCLADVADHVGFSKAHFSHIFKHAVGLSFTTFVQDCRIETAKHHLSHTDQNITNICFACGFNSMTHFNRVFRSFEKMSPRDYRRKISHKSNEM